MKSIVVLGSTGSIGRSALEVARALDGVRVVGLSAFSNWEVLAEQVRTCEPKWVAIADEEAGRRLAARFPVRRFELFTGPEAILTLVREVQADTVLSAVVGGVGLRPALETLRRGIPLALANKEALVMAGELLMAEAEKKCVPVIPVDSEHSAIFQILKSSRAGEIRRLIITASGGPFLRRSRKDLERVTPEEALQHPCWRMGTKVTVDSATFMNKAFEVIEAHHLFGLPLEKIEVVIHPEAVVHSLVEFCDGSVLAQLSHPDMRIPIQYALTYPERLPAERKTLDLAALGTLRFQKVDEKQFPALGLGYEAVRKGGTYGAAFAACDEEAVRLFLEGKVRFLDIYRICLEVLEDFLPKKAPTLEDIVEADSWARQRVRSQVP